MNSPSSKPGFELGILLDYWPEDFVYYLRLIFFVNGNHDALVIIEINGEARTVIIINLFVN